MLNISRKKMRHNLISSMVVVWSIYYYCATTREMRCVNEKKKKYFNEDTHEKYIILCEYNTFQ